MRSFREFKNRGASMKRKRAPRAPVAHTVRSRGLQLEPLESRLLLSVITWAGDIPDGTVWHAGDVQRITADVRITQGSTLTVEPGAIIQINPFAGIDISVQGTLDARGTAANPILITSVRDDTGFDGI